MNSSIFFLPAQALAQALDIWAQKAQLFTPQGSPENAYFAPYDAESLEQEEALAFNPESYVNTAMPPKNFVFAENEALFRWEGKEKIWAEPMQPTAQSRILFGVRPCDAYALKYMQKFFSKEYADLHHDMREKHLFVIAMNCTKPGAQCFCSAQHIGPFVSTENAAGCHLSLTPHAEKQGYWLQVHNEKGQQLLQAISHLVQEVDGKEALKELKEKALAQFTKKLDFKNLRDAMRANFNHSIWEEIAPRCIACTGCTRVCGTCSCFTTHEEIRGEHSGIRVRCWDSCQSEGFTRNAGWHNPRDWVSMVRYRIYDKLQYIEDRFATKGCTGCGRCTRTCPAAIDIAHIAETLIAAHEVEPKNVPEHTIPYVRHERPYDERLYVPRLATIIDLYDEAASIRRFTVRLHDTENAPQQPALLGQFYMITDFGMGEVAISVPFSDKARLELSFYIKKVGKVTSSLFTKKVGDTLGLRGPYGVPFPYDAFKGRNLLVIGSGVGYAPVRAPLIRAIENHQEFKNIIIIASALTYDELMLKEDFKVWAQVPNVRVLYALARPTDKVQAHVGYINDLLPGLEQDLNLDWKETSALVCASARRIKAVAKDLLALGMQSSDIYTALETNMRCGVGKCGHCKVGAHYICVDGPVFTYEHMLQMPPEF